MVRKSQRGGPNQPYTLVVLYKGHVYNLKVRKRPDTQVALGEEKHDELVGIEILIFPSSRAENHQFSFFTNAC